MGLKLHYAYGQTPIDDDDLPGLKIKSISTRQELDEFEQQNIEEAKIWLLRKNISSCDFFSEKFIKDLHFQMLGSVWSWAGKFRQTNKNIGVDWLVINVELKKLLDNCIYWLENKTFSEEEIAIRFKHGLVFIHLFPNGNGRHSRLMADIMMDKIFNKPPFLWGGSDSDFESHGRLDYIQALKMADKGDFESLIRFAKKE